MSGVEITAWRARDADIGKPAAQALRELLSYLKVARYRFVTPTPATHARILARPTSHIAKDLRGAFGWNLPFNAALLPQGMPDRLRVAGLLEDAGGLVKSLVRVSSLGPNLYAHSGFPTVEKDSVFFGPDSYRFAGLIGRELTGCPPKSGARLLDIGSGSGVGAIVASRYCETAEIVLTDVNPRALEFAQVNAREAGVRASCHLGCDLSALGQFDLVLANPPYIADRAGRSYRDGGGGHGSQVALEMAKAALPRLADHGRLILYTGSAILSGRDRLQGLLQQLAAVARCALRYSEIDPDVFGEELDNEAYCNVERIALVTAIIEKEGQA